MMIDQDLCIGCQECVPYCPMGAIVEKGEKIVVDYDECVECEICQRAGVCPTEALLMQKLSWPRILRSQFSNPLMSHPDTQVVGRGTEEIKTNDVTGRLRVGRVGIAAELGRPGIGTRLSDVEKVAMAVAQSGVEYQFEAENPVTVLMTDKDSGTLRKDVLNEKVLSAIVEFEIPLEQVEDALLALESVASDIDTVFSVDLASRVSSDGTNPVAACLPRFRMSENCKTCVGLGRPLWTKEEQR